MDGGNTKRQLVVVIGLITDRKGNVLLQKRADTRIPTADGKWEFPGGRIEYGESPETAIARECKEEVGCDIRIKRLLPSVQSNMWPRSDRDRQHVLVFCYEAEIISGTPHPSDTKVSEVRWFTKDEAAVLDTLPGIMDFIRMSEQY